MSLKGLTDADVKLINKLVRQVLNEREGKGRSNPEQQPAQSSDIYVAKNPGTLPARSGTTLGSATCDIYRVSDSGGLEQLPTNITRTVYNVSDRTITEDYFAVERTAAGKWVTECCGVGGEEVTCLLSTQTGFSGVQRKVVDVGQKNVLVTVPGWTIGTSGTTWIVANTTSGGDPSTTGVALKVINGFGTTIQLYYEGTLLDSQSFAYADIFEATLCVTIDSTLTGTGTGTTTPNITGIVIGDKGNYTKVEGSAALTQTGTYAGVDNDHASVTIPAFTIEKAPDDPGCPCPDDPVPCVWLSAVNDYSGSNFTTTGTWTGKNENSTSDGTQTNTTSQSTALQRAQINLSGISASWTGEVFIKVGTVEFAVAYGNYGPDATVGTATSTGTGTGYSRRLKLTVGGTVVEEEVHTAGAAATEIFVCVDEDGYVTGGADLTDNPNIISEKSSPASGGAVSFGVRNGSGSVTFSSLTWERTRLTGQDNCIACFQDDPCNCCEGTKWGQEHETPRHVRITFNADKTPLVHPGYVDTVDCGFAGAYSDIQTQVDAIQNLPPVLCSYRGLNGGSCYWESPYFTVRGYETHIGLEVTNGALCSADDHDYTVRLTVYSEADDGSGNTCSMLVQWQKYLDGVWCEWSNLNLDFNVIEWREGGLCPGVGTNVPTGILGVDCTGTGSPSADDLSAQQVTALNFQP